MSYDLEKKLNKIRTYVADAEKNEIEKDCVVTFSYSDSCDDGCVYSLSELNNSRPISQTIILSLKWLLYIVVVAAISYLLYFVLLDYIIPFCVWVGHIIAVAAGYIWVVITMIFSLVVAILKFLFVLIVLLFQAIGQLFEWIIVFFDWIRGGIEWLTQ